MFAQETKATSARKLLPPYIRRLCWALHITVIAIALSVAFVLFDNSLFAWHPVFMSLGYIIFMTEGIISAILFRHLEGTDRVTAIQSHALLQLRAAVSLAIGFGVIYRNKVINGKAHFKTLHGKFGLATIILSVLMPLGGALSFRKLGLIQRFPETWQPYVKTLHRQAAVITWLLALVTIELALPHPSVHKKWLTPVWQLGVAAIGAMVLLLSGKANAKYWAQQDDPIAKQV